MEQHASNRHNLFDCRKLLVSIYRFQPGVIIEVKFVYLIDFYDITALFCLSTTYDPSGKVPTGYEVKEGSMPGRASLFFLLW